MFWLSGRSGHGGARLPGTGAWDPAPSRLLTGKGQRGERPHPLDPLPLLQFQTCARGQGRISVHFQPKNFYMSLRKKYRGDDCMDGPDRLVSPYACPDAVLVAPVRGSSRADLERRCRAVCLPPTVVPT